MFGDEAGFSAFIMQQLAAHASAHEMVTALSEVMDEDAESFTMKLWQILIYEQLKLENSQ